MGILFQSVQVHLHRHRAVVLYNLGLTEIPHVGRRVREDPPPAKIHTCEVILQPLRFAARVFEDHLLENTRREYVKCICTGLEMPAEM